jgi:hypothetical protein
MVIEVDFSYTLPVFLVMSIIHASATQKEIYMSYQGERLGELPRGIHAHTFLIEPGPDVVRVTFWSLEGERMTLTLPRKTRDHKDQEHDTEYVFDAHNRAHVAGDDGAVDLERIAKTELELPKDIPLEHQE